MDYRGQITCLEQVGMKANHILTGNQLISFDSNCKQQICEYKLLSGEQGELVTEKHPLTYSFTTHDGVRQDCFLAG